MADEHFKLDADYNENESEDRFYDDISDEELESLKAARKERYRSDDYDPRTAVPQRVVGQKTLIAIVAALFAYYIAIFALNVAGILNGWLMFVLMAAGILILVAVYYWNKRSK